MQTPTAAATTTTMRVVGPDHINLVIRDLDETLDFYCGVLGLTPVGVEEYRAGRRGICSVRVSDDFVIHLRPDTDAPRPVDNDGGYDHLCLTITGITPDALLVYLEENDVDTEGGVAMRWGARGDGAAVYVCDPDGYRVELKIYPPEGA